MRRELLLCLPLLAAFACFEDAPPCASARDCDSKQICEMISDVCVEPDRIIDVGPRNQKPRDLVAAIDTVEPGERVLIRVWPRSSWSEESAAYQGKVVVKGGREVYVVGQRLFGVLPLWAPRDNGTDPALRVEDSSLLRLSSMIVDNSFNEGPAVEVDDATFVVEHSALRAARSLEVATEQSVALRSSAGGIVTATASFLSGAYALRLEGGAVVTLKYVTAVAEMTLANCDDPGDSEAVNSLLVSADGTPNECRLKPVSSQQESAPDYFIDKDAGDFHINGTKAPGSLSSVAQREVGQFSEDIDGDPIPERGYPGADQPTL